MTYVVTIAYRDFVFTDRLEALNFAELAFNSASEPTSIKIEIKREVEADE